MSKKVTLNLNGIGIGGLKDRRHASPCSRSHMVVLPGYGDKNFRFPDAQTLVTNALARLEERYGEGKAPGANDEDETEQGADGGDNNAATDAGASGVDNGANSAEALDLSIRLSAFDRGDVGPRRHSHSHGHSHGTTAKGDGAPPRAVRVPKIGARKKAAAKADDKNAIQFDRSYVPGMPGLPTKGIVAEPLIFKLPEAEQRNIDGTLYLAALGKAIILDEGKYDAIVAERFDPLAGAVNWAREHMDAKYQPAINSLAAQLDQLQKLYKEALPRVLAVLAAQNPEVHPKKLEEAAVGVLDEELVQILTVLRIWTDAFAQRRDGMYKQLEAVTFVVEQAFKLQTQCETGECADKIKTVVFKVGNVFVARFSNQGPATFPGTRGPIGAHAIEVPHDERKMITLMLVLYTHEFRHDIFADVEGLASEETHAVVSQVQEAFAKGQFKFSTDKVVFGRNKFDIIDIIAKFFADTIGEIDADIAGGILQSGPAFIYNMISTFSAMNAGVDGVMKTNRLLRAGSYFELNSQNGQTSLEFLPHPPDYIRAYIGAAALEEIGFPDEAQECRRLADQAVGSPLPEFITWTDVEGKSKSVIKIAFSDLKQVAPVVAKAIIRTPMKSLGGMSMFEIVNWTRHRQDKVDVLTKNLMNASAQVPDGIGDVFATYVASAATMAYWVLCRSGVRPLVAAGVVEENALKMLETVRQRQAAAEAGPAPEHGPCHCGRHPDEASGCTADAGGSNPAEPATKPDGVAPPTPAAPPESAQ